MSVITLSTDFGSDDPYVGIIKGVILGINPQVRLVDLTHDLSHHHLQEAAFILYTAYPYFPRGTIHLAVVDPGVGGARRLIAIQEENSIWIGPDNGLFTLVLKNQPEALIVHLTNTAFFLKTVSATFHGRDILAPAVAHLSLGVSIKEMGETISDPFLLNIPAPEIKENRLIGQVLWMDHFGNLITNISQKMVLPFLSGLSLNIIVGSQTIHEINRTYSQGRPGQLMALIGSSGYLEIACNLGKASEKVGFHPDKGLKVEVFSS
jgi:S-adenosylmethionine hydrolase